MCSTISSVPRAWLTYGGLRGSYSAAVRSRPSATVNPEPLRCVGVHVRDGAGCVDDHHSVVAGGPEHLVHAGDQHAHPLHGRTAEAVVPHVADDDRRLGDLPVGGALDDPDLPAFDAP